MPPLEPLEISVLPGPPQAVRERRRSARVEREEARIVRRWYRPLSRR
jgi:hypothetical protein